jgi:hypothetical protein
VQRLLSADLGRRTHGVGHVPVAEASGRLPRPAAGLGVVLTFTRRRRVSGRRSTECLLLLPSSSRNRPVAAAQLAKVDCRTRLGAAAHVRHLDVSCRRHRSLTDRQRGGPLYLRTGRSPTEGGPAASKAGLCQLSPARTATADPKQLYAAVRRATQNRPFIIRVQPCWRQPEVGKRRS